MNDEAELTGFLTMLDEIEKQPHAFSHAVVGAMAKRAAAIIRRSLPAQGKWLPISSAPKNDNSLLLFGDGRGFEYCTFVGHWTSEGYVASFDGRAVSPSHWQPLPSPPNERNDDDNAPEHNAARAEGQKQSDEPTPSNSNSAGDCGPAGSGRLDSVDAIKQVARERMREMYGEAAEITVEEFLAAKALASSPPPASQAGEGRTTIELPLVNCPRCGIMSEPHECPPLQADAPVEEAQQEIIDSQLTELSLVKAERNRAQRACEQIGERLWEFRRKAALIAASFDAHPNKGGGMSYSDDSLAIAKAILTQLPGNYAGDVEAELDAILHPNAPDGPIADAPVEAGEKCLCEFGPNLEWHDLPNCPHISESIKDGVGPSSFGRLSPPSTPAMQSDAFASASESGEIEWWKEEYRIAHDAWERTQTKLDAAQERIAELKALLKRADPFVGYQAHVPDLLAAIDAALCKEPTE